jgi:HEPN domain-containing protein
MSAHDRRKQREAARGWIGKADDDVATVDAVLALDPPRLGVAAYHVQQAAEKLVKGLLTVAAVPFRRTHNLNELGNQVVGRWPELADAVEHLRPRTTWGVAFRYPRDADIPAEEPSAVEIREALTPVAAFTWFGWSMATRTETTR